MEEPTIDAAVQWIGAGDPLAPDSELVAWITGDEEQAVATAARSVAIAADLTGLLVQQSAGFEHVKRRHYVYVAKDGRLVRAWVGEEGEGPGWTTVDLRDVDGDGRQDIVFWQFWGPMEDRLEQWEVAVYKWNAEQRTFQPAPGGANRPAVYAAMVGGYRTGAEARRAYDARGECVAGFHVVAREGQSGLPSGNVVLAAVSGQRALAEQALRRAAACVPKLEGQIVEVHGSRQAGR